MSPTHWLIVIGVLVLLFGAKKLPDMARSIGQSTRVFKGEMKGLREDDPTDGADAGSAPHESTPQPGAVTPAGVTPSAATDPSTDPAPGSVSTTSTGRSPG